MNVLVHDRAGQRMLGDEADHELEGADEMLAEAWHT